MRMSEIRALSIDELKQKEMDFRKELFGLRFQLSRGELENNMRIREVRKDITKMLTVITEKEVAAADPKRGKGNA
jgi:large subunit ribosomal protein L29